MVHATLALRKSSEARETTTRIPAMRWSSAPVQRQPQAALGEEAGGHRGIGTSAQEHKELHGCTAKQPREPTHSLTAHSRSRDVPLSASGASASAPTSTRVARRAASAPAFLPAGSYDGTEAASRATDRRSSYASRGRDAEAPSTSTTDCVAQSKAKQGKAASAPAGKDNSRGAA